MIKQNIGSSRAISRVINVAHFGVLFLGMALLACLVALPGGASSANMLPCEKDSPATPDELCGHVVSSPNSHNGSGSLGAVAPVSANDVWAVGGYGSYDGARTLVEHWNGTAWTVVPNPNQGTFSNYLNAVAAVSANDVWAVGFYQSYNGGPDQTLVKHWNGSVWTIVSSPNQGVYSNMLTAVAAVSANDVWAVGRYDNSIYNEPRTLVEHWNGSAWTIVPSPNQGTGYNSLYGVAAVSANDVWAVGGYSDWTLVEHWNGSAWTIVPSPSPAGWSSLHAVAAVSANDVWAVGNNYNSTLVEHWNGSAWTIVPSPNHGTDQSGLGSVSAVSTDDIWAVGSYFENGETERTLVEHWNGTAWSVVPSPNPATGFNNVSGVAAVSANDVWAVGSYRNAGTVQTLAVRYVPCGNITPVPASPTPGPPTPTPTPCTAGQFSDVPPGSAFYPYVTCLVNRNIISGYPDCSFKPNDNVTRGQLAKIVSNATGFNDQQTTQMFHDVPVGSTFFQYIGRLASRGYMSGYPCGGVNEPCGGGDLPYFRPNNKASRGQLTKIVSNAAGFQDSIPTSVQTFTDVPPSYTFWVYVERLLMNRPGVMGGYSCGGANEPCDPQQRPYFRPGSNVTRGQNSKIVANTFFPGCQSQAEQ